MAGSERAKKVIASIYSGAAKNLYDPIVVKGAFRLFGGRRLHDSVRAQGRRAVDIAGGRPILDMPVGTAFFTVPVARAHPGPVIGCDIAEGMVRQAKTVAADAGVENLVMVQADAHHLPFASGSFGAVLCTNGLQVIPGLRPTLSELARVLAAGGELLVSVLTAPGPPVRRPRRTGVPTVMLSGEEIAGAIENEGLKVRSLTGQRFASLIEAEKP